MLFLLFTAITAGFIIWSIIDGWYEEVPIIGLIATSVIDVIMLIIIIVSHATVDAEIATLEQRYESLRYQYETNMYDNDNDLGKKELMDAIQEWNENLAGNKENQNNLWIGIFYPNIYDQFEFIELK